MDTSNGNSYNWACGANCAGGIHRTDVWCNCVCLPEAGCQPGESCTSSDQCIGTNYACCDGVCTQTRPDWTGVNYCPDQCKGCFTCAQGTCQQLGEVCSNGDECIQTNNGNGWCCDGICTTTKEGWTGECYCPNQCKGCFTCAQGTCGNQPDCLWPNECVFDDIDIYNK